MYRQHILFIFLFLLATIANSYKLIGRAFHTANYINDKIYFLGGGIETTEYTNDFFYLNVSVPFTLDSLPIFNVSSNVQIAKHGRATSTVCGHNKDTIFLFGGDFDDDESALPLVFAFNISVPQWTNANVRGLEPIRRRWSSSACDKQKMYIFAGTISHHSTFRNDFDILDINRLTWSLGSKVNIPNPRDVATATILSDGKIVFLGGNGGGNIINMSEINLYDTNNDKWSQMVTNGTPPAGRMGHTTVLTKDGRIIVYGGQTFDGPLAHHDQLSVLDTTEQIFRWSIPEIKYTPISAPYVGHTATLVGNYMIVAFGLIYKDKNNPRVFSNQILMLDVSDKNDYKWVTNFTPNTTTTVSVLSIIIKTVIVFMFVLVIFIIAIYSLYRYRISKDTNEHTPLLNNDNC